MATLGSNTVCGLTLSFIALTDVFIVLDVPILRQFFGFALLTFLPGFLILRILQFGKNSLEKALFVVGLSVSFSLFVPLLMNFVYPAIGISHPISLSPLLVTFSVILAGLSLAAYKKGSLGLKINESESTELIGKMTAPHVVGAALIVVIGILGGLSVRFYLDSFFSLLLGLIIVLVVVLIIADKVSRRFYPLYILVIALALQYGRTLASPNLFGTDAMYELYFANLVKMSGIWNPSFSVQAAVSDYYAMLSVAVLPNVYSILLNLDTVWVFKLVYPFIFAFVPLGLYEMFRTQVKFSNKSALLAVFFFMSFFAFFQAMPAITRQEIAELFFVLVALLIMNTYSQAWKKTALLIVFIGSIVVSHYSTSYLFLFSLAIVAIGSAFITSRTRRKRAESAVPLTIVVLAIVVTFGWYMMASAGTPYSLFLAVITHTLDSLSTLFSMSDPFVAAALGGSQTGSALIQELAHYWQLITEAFILIGLAFVIWRRKTPKMSPEFFLFSLASFFILFAIVALPTLGQSLNAYRVYSIALLFLAPYCIFGVEATVETIAGRFRANEGLSLKLTSATLIVVLVPFFLFNYGFISEIAEHPANYDVLSAQNLKGSGVKYFNNASWSYMIQGPIPTESLRASAWVSGSVGHSSVYADWIRAPELSAYGNMSPDSVTIFKNSTVRHIVSNALIYLGPANVQQHNIPLLGFYGQGGISASSVPELAAASRVYDNGLVEVYHTT